MLLMKSRSSGLLRGYSNLKFASLSIMEESIPWFELYSCRYSFSQSLLDITVWSSRGFPMKKMVNLLGVQTRSPAEIEATRIELASIWKPNEVKT